MGLPFGLGQITVTLPNVQLAGYSKKQQHNYVVSNEMTRTRPLLELVAKEIYTIIILYIDSFRIVLFSALECSEYAREQKIALYKRYQ